MRLPVIFSLFLIVPTAANAHVGHLGELAGHSHWVALGAGVVAAALVAWLGKEKIKADSEEEVAEDSVEHGVEDGGETSGEQSGAPA